MRVKTTCRSILIILVGLMLSVYAVAQSRALTPETILGIRNIVDAQLSPDGQTIVFQVARARRDDERSGPAVSELWIVSAKGGQPERFTYNDKSDRLPQWSPDGKWLAFLSERGESAVAQIYLISPGGGEAMPLTRSETAIGAFKWSPDSSRIAYTATDGKSKDELEAERQGKDWVIADRNYKHTRLYVSEVKTRGTPLAISLIVTTQPLTIQEFDWSPDAKQFVVSATDTPNVDDAYMRSKLLTIPATGGEPKQIARTEGKLTFPRWSPDGNWIGWLGATSMDDPFAGSVFVVPATGGTAENLLKGYSGTADWLGWLPGRTSTIVFRAIERQTNLLYTVSLPDRKRESILQQEVILNSGPSFNSDSKRMVITANSSKHPNEVFIGDTNGKTLSRITRFNPQLDGLALGEQEVVKWKSKDGWEIEGVICKPVGYNRGTRYPLVMQPHGGPEGADLNGWMGGATRWGQMLAGRGL